ncbi:hypothetical protein PAPYR_6582 [Paratrimastix pyriformis]|uniref:DDH domain-containing protein n=1 Tax=Paratrimastix pyriformis TaxID=342808 RepID=A0ABQ8UH98_9EUKA|nr:hypothetical protein PAPYR_6582 [Paratrimastix pyriformis]
MQVPVPPSRDPLLPFVGKRVYVVGHNQPDVDSTVSALLCSEWLRWRGIDAIPVRLSADPLDEITSRVTTEIGCPPFGTLQEKAQCIFLVDHNELSQSFGEERTDLEIVGIVDHHQDTGPKSKFRWILPCGCCAQLIIALMEADGYRPLLDPNPERTRLLRWALHTLLVDTGCLTTTKATPHDRALAGQWAAELGLSEDFLRSRTIIPTDLGLPLTILGRNGHKVHLCSGLKFSSAYLEVIRWDAATRDRISEVARWHAEHRDPSWALQFLLVRDFAQGRTWAVFSGPLARCCRHGMRMCDIPARLADFPPVEQTPVFPFDHHHQEDSLAHPGCCPPSTTPSPSPSPKSAAAIPFATLALSSELPMGTLDTSEEGEVFRTHYPLICSRGSRTNQFIVPPTRAQPAIMESSKPEVVQSSSPVFDPKGAIDIKIHHLSQLFNSYDPSPFLEKDLDDDAEEYIVTWARELPGKVPLSLVIHTTEETASRADVDTLRASIRKFFKSRHKGKKRDFNHLMGQGRKYLWVTSLCPW